MFLKWFIFGLTFSAILAVGKKRARIDDDGDDDCFPDGFFDISDAHKTISDWNRLSLEVLKLKCMDVALSGRGSRINLASRLYYHYHPSPILQSEERPSFINNSTTPPSFSTVYTSNTPVLSNLRSTVNPQTEAVPTTTNIPRLRSTQTVTRTTSFSTNSGIINWTSPASFIQAPSANTTPYGTITTDISAPSTNATPHGVIPTDISALIRNEVRSVFSSPELINAISNQLLARQPLVDDPSPGLSKLVFMVHVFSLKIVRATSICVHVRARNFFVTKNRL